MHTGEIFCGSKKTSKIFQAQQYFYGIQGTCKTGSHPIQQTKNKMLKSNPMKLRISQIGKQQNTKFHQGTFYDPYCSSFKETMTQKATQKESLK
jgi:hypothetical protein